MWQFTRPGTQSDWTHLLWENRHLSGLSGSKMEATNLASCQQCDPGRPELRLMMRRLNIGVSSKTVITNIVKWISHSKCNYIKLYPFSYSKWWYSIDEKWWKWIIWIPISTNQHEKKCCKDLGRWHGQGFNQQIGASSINACEQCVGVPGFEIGWVTPDCNEFGRHRTPLIMGTPLNIMA